MLKKFPPNNISSSSGTRGKEKGNGKGKRKASSKKIKKKDWEEEGVADP